MADRSALPVPIDRTALERVLARAAELQGESGESVTPTDDLTEEQVIELGREVGLSAQFLRQALAEERTRAGDPIPESGVLAKYVGPSRISAARTIAGNPRTLLSALDTWMQKDECLQVKRQYGDRIVWESRRDLLSNFRRGMDFGGRGYVLARSLEVSGTAVPLDESRCVVRLDADFSEHRSRVTRDGTLTLGAGGFATAAALAMNVVLPVALIPVLGLAGLGYIQARKRHRHTLSRAQLALEQVLDRLERGELARPSIRGLLGGLISD
jgi:hypothetical protein